ncbi:MAG: gliding motility protein [Archangiaceae bacterium]|nr:gliding motility protein [Archangiaceae bacterium]
MGAPLPTASELSLLDAGNFATRFARGDLRERTVMRLRGLLARLDADLPPAAFAEWLDDLFHWLRARGKLPEQRPSESTAAARLRTLFEAAEHLPEQVARLRAASARLFATSRGVTLFTDVGVPSRQGFFAEALDRASRSLLPDPPPDGDLADVLTRLFDSRRAVEWFEALTAEESAALFRLLALPEGPEVKPLLDDMTEAAVLLAARVMSHGLGNDVRARSEPGPLERSPFFALPDAVRAAVRGERADACRETISACRKGLKQVEDALERTGVSVDLVYRLDLMRRQLDRLYALLGLVAPADGAPAQGAAVRLLLVLVRGAYRDRSVLELLKGSTRLLARRVVDAAAHGGGHYVTRTPAEYHALVDSAAGGGLITAFTALFKFVFGWAGLAPFWEGFFFSLNYTGSFVAMQLMGFTLASKQPSMTAAHLARAMGESPAEDRELSALAAEVARTVRSQLAATLGNLAVVVPVAVLIDLTLRVAFGRGLLDSAYADKVVANHHPLKTVLVPGAMLTGVALWLSSVAAGTVENWVVYRRLPQAVASHRGMRALLGAERAREVAAWLKKHVAGIGGNVALGLQMGLLPTFGVFFGVPLVLPHVAVSTGQLAFAGAARGAHGVLQADFAWALAGVGLVGVMNFGVSFALALWVALRAREAGTLATVRLVRAVGRLFLARPADFFRPPPNG